MKSAIMNESGIIDAMHARIAAAKLAQVEANDQSAQLLQALEAEDAAVKKARFQFCILLLLFTLFFRSLMIFPQLKCSNKQLKRKFPIRVLGRMQPCLNWSR